MTKETKKPLIVRILPDTLAFGIVLVVAYVLQWETRDLVWSLWLGSLVLGYLTLLSAIGGGTYIGLQAIRSRVLKKKQRVLSAFSGIVMGIVMLVFFSVHFCGFHAGHSVLLSKFIPIDGMPDEGFGRAFMNPPLLWMLAFRHLIQPYGAFLIPAIIAERNHVFLPLQQSIRAVQSGAPIEVRNDGKKRKDNRLIGNAMIRPYMNVLRMHLLIFLFAFCNFLKIDSFAVYAAVCFVYFFPWSEIKKARASNKPAAGDGKNHV